MSACSVTFYKCVQNSHNLGSNDQYMVSRVCFTMLVNNKLYENLYVDVIQETSCDPATGPLKVGVPQGCPRVLDYSLIQTAAEKYYRICGKNSCPRDNTVSRIMISEIDI